MNITDFSIRIVPTGINAAVNDDIDIAIYITAIRATVNIFDISIYGHVNIAIDMSINATTYYGSTIILALIKPTLSRQRFWTYFSCTHLKKVSCAIES